MIHPRSHIPVAHHLITTMSQIRFQREHHPPQSHSETTSPARHPTYRSPISVKHSPRSLSPLPWHPSSPPLQPPRKRLCLLLQLLHHRQSPLMTSPATSLTTTHGTRTTPGQSMKPSIESKQ